MGLIQKMSENIKKGIRTWLNIVPASPYNIQINEVLDFEMGAIRNRIWFRGDGNELEQLYQSLTEYTDKYKFWGSRCTPGMEMRKIHTGLPGLMVRVLTSVVLTDMNEYEFTEETKVICGRKLHRIRALRNFGDVKAGALGGFIEKEENLSHEGNCWVYDNTKVYNNAEIRDNAIIFGNAVIHRGNGISHLYTYKVQNGRFMYLQKIR